MEDLNMASFADQYSMKFCALITYCFIEKLSVEEVVNKLCGAGLKTSRKAMF